jgi:hypothetical protein
MYVQTCTRPVPAQFDGFLVYPSSAIFPMNLGEEELFR